MNGKTMVEPGSNMINGFLIRICVIRLSWQWHNLAKLSTIASIINQLQKCPKVMGQNPSADHSK